MTYDAFSAHTLQVSFDNVVTLNILEHFLEILKSDAFCGYGYCAEMVERDSDVLVNKIKPGRLAVGRAPHHYF